MSGLIIGDRAGVMEMKVADVMQPPLSLYTHDHTHPGPRHYQLPQLTVQERLAKCRPNRWPSHLGTNATTITTTTTMTNPAASPVLPPNDLAQQKTPESSFIERKPKLVHTRGERRVMQQTMTNETMNRYKREQMRITSGIRVDYTEHTVNSMIRREKHAVTGETRNNRRRGGIATTKRRMKMAKEKIMGEVCGYCKEVVVCNTDQEAPGAIFCDQGEWCR